MGFILYLLQQTTAHLDFFLTTWLIKNVLSLCTCGLHVSGTMQKYCIIVIDNGLVLKYRKTSNIRHTLVGNKIVDHSDVVGALPVGAAPTTSSFST